MQIVTKSPEGGTSILIFSISLSSVHISLWEKVNRWVGTPGWDKHVRRSWAYESQERVRRRMRVEHGEAWPAVRSFLYPKYPECAEFNKAEFLRQKMADKAAAAAQSVE